jgi:hypothetical protein
MTERRKQWIRAENWVSVFVGFAGRGREKGNENQMYLMQE